MTRAVYVVKMLSTESNGACRWLFSKKKNEMCLIDKLVLFYIKTVLGITPKKYVLLKLTRSRFTTLIIYTQEMCHILINVYLYFLNKIK